MKISNSIYFTSQSLKKNNTNTKTQNEFKNINLNSNPIANLNHFSIAFCAMKKSQFEGIDLMMVNQLQAPIQKFNSNDDFQSYCQNILDKKYLGEKNFERLSYSLDGEANEHKKAILKDWINYITIENKAYTPAIQLMILSSITKNLNYKTNHLPPVLDKRKLADTIQEINNSAKTKKNYSCNFDKLYRNNLTKEIFQAESQIDSNLNGWIKIPSKTHDPQNFEANVKKLQILSHDSWCTKSFNAEPYLAKGDFHIYFEQGKPKVGLRFGKDTIEEIQGEKNDSQIPFLYFDEIKKHIQENKLKIDQSLTDSMQTAAEKKKSYDSIGKDAIANVDLSKILPYYGIKFKQDENQMFILDTVAGNFTFHTQPLKPEELGLNYKDIFSKVIKIEGNFTAPDNFNSTGNIEEIGGNLYLNESKIQSLDKIKKIGGNLGAQYVFTLESLGDLKYIGGNMNLPYSKKLMDEVLNLDYIGGYLTFENGYKSYKQPNLLLSSTPLSRPITYDEYESWEIDRKNLTLNEIQGKINNEDFDDLMATIFGDDWIK